MDRKDAWQAGYDDAHNDIDADETEQEIHSYLWRLDYSNGKAVHDSLCGEH